MDMIPIRRVLIEVWRQETTPNKAFSILKRQLKLDVSDLRPLLDEVAGKSLSVTRLESQIKKALAKKEDNQERAIAC